MARTVQLWRDEAPPAPMLATPCELDSVNLANSSLLYEQKFDGIRAIVVVEPAHPTARVRLLSRNGNDKAAQFPEIVRALRELAGQLNGPVVLDGEIVALDARGRPTSFTALQSRMHLKGALDIEARIATVPTALIVFDLLREGVEDLRPQPLAARRARLEHLLHVRTSERLREGAYTAGDGTRVLAHAERDDWEGLIVKDADAPYLSGVRSRTWRKVKLHKRATLAHRRLDGSEGHARRIRRPDGRRSRRCPRETGTSGQGQRGHALLCGQRRHRLQRRHDHRRPRAPASAGPRHLAVRRRAARPWPALGRAAPALRSPLQRMDARGAPASSGVPRAA